MLSSDEIVHTVVFQALHFMKSTWDNIFSIIYSYRFHWFRNAFIVLSYQINEFYGNHEQNRKQIQIAFPSKGIMDTMYEINQFIISRLNFAISIR